MNHGTGQMAEIVRYTPVWPTSPGPTVGPTRVARTVPVLQRAPWQPWPWRTWGRRWLYPRYAYEGGSWTPYGWWSASSTPYPYAWGDADGGGTAEIVGQSQSAFGRATQMLAAAIRDSATHNQPPAWKPTRDFQAAFNWSFGPIGGLGTTTKPELLKVDGIYGKRSEMALAKALGGLDKVMALYGAPTTPGMPPPPTPAAPAPKIREPGAFTFGPPGSAAAGQHIDIVGPAPNARFGFVLGGNVDLLNRSPHVFDVLAGAPYGAGQQLAIIGPAPGVHGVIAGADAPPLGLPPLVAAVQELHGMLSSERGFIGVYEGADSGNGITVLVLPAFVREMHDFVHQTLGGSFRGFPIMVLPGYGYSRPEGYPIVPFGYHSR